MQQPKGRLLIIGGHEEKIFTGERYTSVRSGINVPHFDILGTLINSIPHSHRRIEVIAAASSIPDEMEAAYIAAYESAGYDHVGIMRVDDAGDVVSPEFISRIHYAHAVFFTGGDQRLLTKALRDTELLEAILKKYRADPHFIVAGTSAGAMSLPQVIIERGVIEEALLKNDLVLGTGFGFIDNVIVDTHFIRRGRIGRLAHAVALNKPFTGIGLGEDGALLISKGCEAECLGSGMVVIIDSSELGATNAGTADEATPIAIENLKMHILAEGCRYDLQTRQFSLKD